MKKELIISILLLVLLLPIISAEEEIAFWGDANGRPITDYNIVLGETQFTLFYDNPKLSGGTEVEFIVKESDMGVDDTITTLTANVDSNGDASILWLPTKEDLEKGALDNVFDEQDIYELGQFYFEVEGEPSGILQFSVLQESFCTPIGFCRDYETQGDCETDFCQVNNKSVEMNYGRDICGEVSLFSGCEIESVCSCEWKSGKCGPNKKEVFICGDENPSIIGQCFYDENYSDDCDDGFLEYSWVGIYTWEDNNTFGSEKSGEEGYIEVGGNWHYDPQRENENCLDGNNIVQCPSRALVSYFTFMNVIVTLIIIGIIYYFLSEKKVKKKSKRKKKR